MQNRYYVTHGNDTAAVDASSPGEAAGLYAVRYMDLQAPVAVRASDYLPNGRWEVRAEFRLVSDGRELGRVYVDSKLRDGARTCHVCGRVFYYDRACCA